MTDMIAVRGAVTVKGNNAEDITQAATGLLGEVLRVNNIKPDDLISVSFTLTDDLTKKSPASAVRHAGLVPEYTALFCMQEAKVENGLPMCLRILVNARSQILQRFVRHVYQEGAKALRPDLGGMRYFQIAIDGPAGTGKTTIAKLVASRMNIAYLDTGAIYRTVAVAALARDISPADAAAVERLIKNISVTVRFAEKKQRMILDGVDTTEKIRENIISQEVSRFSPHAAVRQFVTSICRETAVNQSIVMEGRDICRSVLPDADVKVYLDAALPTRARRRYNEMIAQGQEVKYEDILADIAERDKNDSSREHSPLLRTEHSIYIDGTNLTVEDVFNIILEAL